MIRNFPFSSSHEFFPPATYLELEGGPLCPTPEHGQLTKREQPELEMATQGTCCGPSSHLLRTQRITEWLRLEGTSEDHLG